MNTPFGDFIVIAHRGAQEDADENTIPAFEDAGRIGADGVEFDIWLHKPSDKLIVFHDETLNRMTGDPRRIDEIPCDALDDLRTTRRGEAIPTLREALRATGGLMINIECKGVGTGCALGRKFAHVAGGVIAHPERIIVSAFDWSELIAFRHGYGTSNVRTALLWERPIATLPPIPERISPSALHIPVENIEGCGMDIARRMGLPVFVYTVNDPRMLPRLRTFNIAGFFTDFPSRFAV